MRMPTTVHGTLVAGRCKSELSPDETSFSPRSKSCGYATAHTSARRLPSSTPSMRQIICPRSILRFGSSCSKVIGSMRPLCGVWTARWRESFPHRKVFGTNTGCWCNILRGATWAVWVIFTTHSLASCLLCSAFEMSTFTGAIRVRALSYRFPGLPFIHCLYDPRRADGR